MKVPAIPSGPDFETALAYLDDDLPETDQILFEIRLSEDPELADQFSRLAALDMAQRILAREGLFGTPPPTRVAAPSRRSVRSVQLAAVLTAALVGAALVWRLLVEPPQADPRHTTIATSGDAHDRGEYDRRGLVRGVRLPESEQLGESLADSSLSTVFVIGFPSHGTPIRLLPSAAGAPANQPKSRAQYRLVRPSSTANRIEESASRGEFVWPAGAERMSSLIVGHAPSGRAQFLDALDARLRNEEIVTVSALREWLSMWRSTDVCEFVVER